ncbi:MAG: Ig-like domain-containing protein, partial [Bifidobacteriaceae bacterium]|nr:Ig-like domain-containing protein [Bifidobacteriaceae bacterium]
CDPAAASPPAYCLAGGVFQTGLAYVEFTSEEPGTFQIQARAAGGTAAGTPAQVSFVSGPADADKSAWSIVPDTADPIGGDKVTVPATGVDSYALTVKAVSASGLPVPGARVRISGLPASVAGGSGEGATGDPASGSFGAHTWQLSSTAQGEHRGQVQLWNGSAWVGVGAPFTVRFAAGAGVPGNSWLVQPASPAVADGAAPLRVEALVFDSQGNPAPGGKVEFQLPAGVWEAGGTPAAGASAVEATVAAGTAAVNLVSRTAGPYQVTASLAAAGADQIMTVKDASGGVLRADGVVELRFAAGAVSGEDSVLTIPTAGTPTQVGGATHRAEVRVVDAAGNPVPGAKVVFSWAPGTAQGPTGAWTAVPEAPTDAAGLAAYEFAAPANQAGWVWVKASADSGAGAQAVGGPQTAPPAQQTVLGARFEAGPVDAAATQAAFEVYGGAVAPDLKALSWARVQVKDRYGNGVPGVDVAFELPASHPGTAGTPVFAGGAATASGKQITVATCAADLVQPPAACLLNGVYTPGLAVAEIVSGFEGVFPVVAVAAAPGGDVKLGPGEVVFDSGAPSAAHSSFTLEQTDKAAPRVVADSVQSYTLTATVVNALGGAARHPVEGACVAPRLPAGLSVSAPASGAPCQAGHYPTDKDGVASLRIVSTVSGKFEVGLDLGGDQVPTEAGGNQHTREAVFAGGPPSAARTELTSPKAPTPADDPAGLAVTATVRDAHGNLAACWDGAKAAPCEVEFAIPAGLRVGEGPGAVAGPGWATAKTDPDSGVARVVYRGGAGTYTVTARVAGRNVALADGVDWSPAAGRAKVVFGAPTTPGKPALKPSDGSSIGGTGTAPGNPVVVKDEAGNVLCSTVVGPDLTWSCDLEPPAKEGDRLVVVEQDALGNASEKEWRVGVPRLELAEDRVCGGQGQAATGVNFQPAEAVGLEADGAPDGASAQADQDGRVRFEWTVPAGAAGAQRVVLRGPDSGEVAGEFEAACEPAPPGSVAPPVPGGNLPYTGARGIAKLAAGGLGLAAAGLILVWAAARGRRREG